MEPANQCELVSVYLKKTIIIHTVLFWEERHLTLTQELYQQWNGAQAAKSTSLTNKFLISQTAPEVLLTGFMLCELTGFHLKSTREIQQTSGKEVRAGVRCVTTQSYEICPWNKTASYDSLYLAMYDWSPAPTFRARSYAAELQTSLSWASSRTCSSSHLLCNLYNSRYSSKRLEEGKDS